MFGKISAFWNLYRFTLCLKRLVLKSTCYRELPARWVFFSFFLIFSHFLLMFEYSCLHFPTTTFPALPMSTSHPQSLPPLALSMGSSSMFISVPFYSFPRYFPLPSPLVTVSLLSISMSPAIFCSPVCFVN